MESGYPGEAPGGHTSFCRLVKMYQEYTKGLVMALGHTAEAQAARATILRNAKLIKGVEMKSGRPPAGFMEREFGGWLKALLG